MSDETEYAVFDWHTGWVRPAGRGLARAQVAMTEYQQQVIGWRTTFLELFTFEEARRLHRAWVAGRSEGRLLPEGMDPDGIV